MVSLITRLLGAKLACMQVVAWGEIACQGGANDGLPTQAKEIKGIEPHRYPACACVYGPRRRKGDSENLVRGMVVNAP